MAVKKASCILCIEDERLVRDSIVAYLEDSGYRVLEASDGESGLALAQDPLCDLVLTDLQMPGMGGLEVLGQIRATNPLLPILVVSGAGALKDAVEALRLGAWDYLIKPLADLQVLEHAIEKALEKKHLLAENQRYKELTEQHLRLLQEDQEAGLHVQQQLLPAPMSHFGEYRIAFLWQPAVYLSGDFVDYFIVQDRYLIYYLADVSGHGAASAFITILLKHAVRNQSEEFLLYPDKMLCMLNRLLYREKLGKYLTMSYHVLDLNTHQACYAIAGHYPPPLHRDTREELTELPGRGHAIGICESPSFDVLYYDFKPCAGVVLCSDGVLEAMPGADMSQQQEAWHEALRPQPWTSEGLKSALYWEKKVPEEWVDDRSILWITRA